MTLDPQIQIWVTLVAAAAAMVSFAWERVSLELTSLLLLVFLLVWFQVFPLIGPAGANLLSPGVLFSGFANPSLIAVLALIVMGQALVQTGALTALSRQFIRLSRRHRRLSVASGFGSVMLTSAFLNNTPVVVMFIPVMQGLAQRLRWSVSRLMMPLSFAAILGGMITLIGSSTNLLVASALRDMGEGTLGMFDFAILGIALAAVGAVYVIFILPRLLPHRGDLSGMLITGGKQFVAEIDVATESPLIGHRAQAGQFKSLPEITVRLIQRRGQNILPPFEGIELEAGDVLIVAATRQALINALARNPGYLLSRTQDSAGPAVGLATAPAQTSGSTGSGSTPPTRTKGTERQLAEVMIAPASRMIDQTIDMVGFSRRFGCLVLGIQRRGRMARQRIGEIRLEAGDVLLLVGRQDTIDNLANNPDLILMAGGIRDIPQIRKAPIAIGIFAGVVALAAFGLLPISVAAVTGVTAMLATDCINIRQAVRALDRTVFLLVGAALALGAAMQQTGAAAYVANGLVQLIGTDDPVVAMTSLFLIIAVATNILSNNACAVLFTPIAVSLAATLGMDPKIMAITVLLAANCSFATPIGYQTNLLVMGPGHYRFIDFLRGGLPLVLLIWLTFCLLAPGYFGLT